MQIWLALIVAPLLALTDQAIAFSLVGWACAHQNAALLHAEHSFFLALATAAAIMAFRYWRKTGRANAGTPDAARRQLHFLAGLAATVAAFAALAIAAMWIPTWMISACNA